jgi:hypothetical protein
LSRETFRKKVITKTLASKIMRTVHSHEGFWFYKAPGDYTGKNATSLKDFAKMLQAVDVQSVDFHFSRGDFRRWMQFILARASDLIKAVNERIIELKKI